MVDLGKLSSPGPLPSLKFFTTSKSSFILTESKFCREDDETGVRYTLKDNGMILLARFGPTLAKCWQNLFAMSSESVIVTPCSCINETLIGLHFERFRSTI